ncbi:DUF305 domain-containing protein [Ornithinimicrobium humiphilum]|uniref:DUF305 domain-containing protein n=1 Tax=Ornithinimicrobium humiphilum TaxID=125288 RepID=UPI0031D3D8F1
MRRSTAAAAVLAAVIVLGGCSGEEEQAMPDTPILQAGAPGEDPVLLTEMPSIAEPEITTDDVDFVRHMIAHHGQALQMTALVPDRSSREDVPLFAERLHLSQEDEIRLMEEWLDEHRLEVLRLDEKSGGHAGHVDMATMPGVITEEQLAALEAASGEEFDRMFLELMYAHHEGALTMVEELWAGDFSGEVRLNNLIREIDSDQRIEMDRINQMLASMGPADQG